MPEFLQLLPPADALQRLFAHFTPQPQPEEMDVESACGRVTYGSILATGPLPAFPRSTVDGYAVRAADTYGASDSLPAYLAVRGEVPMGSAPAFHLSPAECAMIHTGGMLPEEADAVVMVEHTQTASPAEVEILRAVAIGENVLRVGEDVAEGEAVIPSGARLRPAEIGGLMASGITRVMVARRPRVGIISSGDEIIPPGAVTAPGQVRDVNAYSLSALVDEAGGQPMRYGIVPDQAPALKGMAARALQECELVLITAGSSASTRDLTAEVLNSLGKPGVLVHGVNVRPGKPTILAVCEGKVMIGLPGNPVSALVIASLFVTPVISALLGLNTTRPRPSVPARLTINLASQAGREDWTPVRLVPDPGQPGHWLADPVFGKSNLIFSLARADGLVRIPPDANGLSSGARVDVILL